jgi:hypothetical protein
MRAVPAAATYPVQVADWVTISSLATAGGTLVLATATFASVRSANRAARVAEESLLAATRPLLMPSRTEDPPIRVGFGDDHFVLTPGGGGTAEVTDTATYLTMSVRNVGSDIAVLHGWRVEPSFELAQAGHPALDGFRRLTRDLYIAAGDVAFWQGAFRDPAQPELDDVGGRIAARAHRSRSAVWRPPGQPTSDQPVLVEAARGRYVAGYGRTALERRPLRPALRRPTASARH